MRKGTARRLGWLSLLPLGLIVLAYLLGSFKVQLPPGWEQAAMRGLWPRIEYLKIILLGLFYLANLTMVVIFFIHCWRLPRPSVPAKFLWSMALVLGHVLVLPFYWLMFIRPQGQVSPTPGASPAGGAGIGTARK
jgi:hypothetical protein